MMRYLRRIFWFALPCALLASLAVNVTAWIWLKREYREMKSVRLDPLGVRDAKFPADSPSVTTPAAPLVLFFGDSRAAMWPAPNLPGWRFSNRGIDGQTTEQAIGRLHDEVSALKPRIIVLECGINDLTAVGVLPDQRDMIVARCRENLHEMIEIGRTSGATVIITTILPTSSVSLARRPFWSDKIPEAIETVNDDLRNIHEPNVLILNADQLLLDRGEMPSAYALDTLHLTPQGYARLNLSLEKYLDVKSDAPR